MANMSYCRFRNTKIDLFDCVCTLQERGIPDDKDEKDAALRMYQLCQEYIDAYEYADENADLDEEVRHEDII